MTLPKIFIYYYKNENRPVTCMIYIAMFCCHCIGLIHLNIVCLDDCFVILNKSKAWHLLLTVLWDTEQYQCFCVKYSIGVRFRYNKLKKTLCSIRVPSWEDSCIFVSCLMQQTLWAKWTLYFVALEVLYLKCDVKIQYKTKIIGVWYLTLYETAVLCSSSTEC